MKCYIYCRLGREEQAEELKETEEKRKKEQFEQFMKLLEAKNRKITIPKLRLSNDKNGLKKETI